MSKFASGLAEELYDASLDGGESASLGTSDGFGWRALFIMDGWGAIICENSQGFVNISEYESEEEAEAEWSELEKAFERYETLALVDSLDTSGCDELFLIIDTARHHIDALPSYEEIENHISSHRECYDRNGWALEV